MKFESLKEASHIGAVPSDISRQLVIIPFPPNLDSEQFFDWDERYGFGGADSIVLDDPHVLITTKDRASEFTELLQAADKFFSR